MKKFAFRSFAVVAALSFVLAGGLGGLGCERDNSSQTQPSTGAQSLPTVKMKIGNRTFDLEVAKTSEQQALGLMKRDSMPQDHGMIFTFAEERMLEFWMKDTRIPLDIIYLDARGKVVSVSQMRAYDLTSISSEIPAQYAIELNAGLVKQVGIKSGDVLDIPAPARSSDKPPTSQP
ncbi:MAG TPA: DUF192 domain-containing protein [Tepidisphaeraceae bacterium]|jgi:uncharacterized membrane protein (UPF0127 family)